MEIGDFVRKRLDIIQNFSWDIKKYLKQFSTRYNFN